LWRSGRMFGLTRWRDGKRRRAVVVARRIDRNIEFWSASRSLTSELVALNETLQPQACIGDRLCTLYALGHVQEVRLQAPRNFVPKEYCGSPELSQSNLVLGVSGVSPWLLLAA
jgi:hypothetical protein